MQNSGLKISAHSPNFIQDSLGYIKTLIIAMSAQLNFILAGVPPGTRPTAPLPLVQVVRQRGPTGVAHLQGPVVHQGALVALHRGLRAGPLGQILLLPEVWGRPGLAAHLADLHLELVLVRAGVALPPAARLVAGARVLFQVLAGRVGPGRAERPAVPQALPLGLVLPPGAGPR